MPRGDILISKDKFCCSHTFQQELNIYHFSPQIISSTMCNRFLFYFTPRSGALFGASLGTVGGMGLLISGFLTFVLPLAFGGGFFWEPLVRFSVKHMLTIKKSAHVCICGHKLPISCYLIAFPLSQITLLLGCIQFGISLALMIAVDRGRATETTYFAYIIYNSIMFLISLGSEENTCTLKCSFTPFEFLSTQA